MAVADDDRGCADGASRSQEHGAHSRAGSDDRRISAADAASARRCPRLLEGQRSGAHTIQSPPMPGAAWHLPLARNGEKASKRGRFADTTIGYVHIDICELRLAEGKLNMFLAIDRVSKFTYVEFHENAGKMNGAAFLANVVKVFPYKIHTVLTDNGMAFADLPKIRNGATRSTSARTSSIVCAPGQMLVDDWSLAHHLILIFSARITFAHFSVSSATKAPNSAGLITTGSAPVAASFPGMPVWTRASLIAAFSFSIIWASVPAGAPNPFQM